MKILGLHLNVSTWDKIASFLFLGAFSLAVAGVTALIVHLLGAPLPYAAGEAGTASVVYVALSLVFLSAGWYIDKRVSAKTSDDDETV